MKSLKRAKTVLSCLLTIVLFFYVFMPFMSYAIAAEGTANTGRVQRDKKVIVFILDAISWDDLQSANAPNLKGLAENGYVGLMNTKTRGMNRVNPESGYFTMGVGVRANAPDNSGQDVVQSKDGSIKVGKVDQLKVQLAKELPNYQVGQFGSTAKQLGLKIALVGNADSKDHHREAALLAMDEKGKIPYGSIGSNLLLKDTDFPGGVRTDVTILYHEVLRIMPEVDILVIDFGDTARIDRYYEITGSVFRERGLAIARADKFLGRVLKNIDPARTMVMVVVPNASQTSVRKGNTSLTPVIISEGGEGSGFLISNTTHREGVISNIDFAPSVFNFLTGSNGNFVGEPATYRDIEKDASGNISKIQKKSNKFFNLRWGRYISHGFYVTLIVLSIAFLFVKPVANYFRVSERFKYRLSVTALVFPLTTYVVGPLLPFRHFIIESVTILLIAIVLSQVLANWLRTKEHVITLVTLSTSLVILSYLFAAPSFLLNSPIGFLDVFLGVRYYGINNDSMGILLGSTIMGLFLLSQLTRWPDWIKKILIVLFMIGVVVSLTPGFGANVGGTISAMSVTVLTGLFLFSRGKLNWQKVVLIVGIVFAVEVGIAYLDSLLDPPRTHAGRSIQALLANDFGSKLVELLLAKLRLFALMSVVPPYNIIMVAELLLFARIINKKDFGAESFFKRMPVMEGLAMIFLYGGLIAYLFNDTGVIASAMMYTYFIIPYGILSKK